MSSFQTERLDPIQWLVLPALACMGATVLFSVPLTVAGVSLPEPVFGMILAFAWAIIRPSILAPFGLLATGLFMDLFWGAPLGLWALSLLAAYGGVLGTRNMMTGQSRPMVWAWFAFMTGVAMTTGYCISILDSGMAPSLVAVFWQFLPTVLLYPFAHRLTERFEDADVRFR
jgi:rod shape-determining protein MreD